MSSDVAAVNETDHLIAGLFVSKVRGLRLVLVKMRMCRQLALVVCHLRQTNPVPE